MTHTRCRTYGARHSLAFNPALTGLCRNRKTSSSAAKAVKQRRDLCRTERSDPQLQQKLQRAGLKGDAPPALEERPNPRPLRSRFAGNDGLAVMREERRASPASTIQRERRGRAKARPYTRAGQSGEEGRD